MELFYLDPGVFVTPLLKNHPAAIISTCERWLERLGRGEVGAVTSLLTWDEVTHVAGSAPKPYDHKRAVQAGELFLGLPGLRFVPVDQDIILLAQTFLPRLKPRDSIHAATALLHAGGKLVTLDSDFPSQREAKAMGLQIDRIMTA